MTDTITDILANDIRAIDGDHDLGAGALAEGLVKLGWIKVKVHEVLPLTSYKDGETVEVIKDGDWMLGMINGVERRLGLLYVHTERGPVSVASPKSIRKWVSPA